MLKHHITVMIKFIPIILPLVYGLVMFRLSAWQLNRTLKRQSSLLADRQLLRPIQLLANALDLESISVSIYEIEPVNGLAAPIALPSVIFSNFLLKWTGISCFLQASYKILTKSARWQKENKSLLLKFR